MRELDALRARGKQVARGQGGMVLISGEAGVGKMRLTEEFSAAVRWRGEMVACGRCYEPERVLPYQPLAEILRDLTMQEERLGLTLPAWVHGELARLVPELVTPSTHPEPPYGLVQPERQAILFHAIAAFIGHCASRRPLLIVLEDLHWATDSTLAAIHYLARQLVNMHVWVIGTFRPEEVGETLITTMAWLGPVWTLQPLI